jgi:hypothetical protein
MPVAVSESIFPTARAGRPPRSAWVLSLLLCHACVASDSGDAGPRTTPPSFQEAPTDQPVRPDAADGAVAPDVPADREPVGTPQTSELCARRPLAALDLALPTWDLFVTDERWDALHQDVSAEVRVDARICIDGREYPIGLELQGASTRKLSKKSFDLKFDRGVPLHAPPFRDTGSSPSAGDQDYERIIMKAMFRDHSLIREAVAFDLWREMGHQAPRIGFANLRINGDYWGLYVLVEPVNGAYLRRHGYPPGGNLYKAVRKNGERADFVPGRDLELAFENKTDEADPSRDDLAALIDALQHTPLDHEAFLRDIDPIFSLERYFDRLVWVAFTQNGDAVAQNYFLYNAPQGGRDQWSQLPWDSNLCFSASWKSADQVLPPEESMLIDGRNYFGQRLVRVPELRDAYIARFHEVMDVVLPPALVQRRYRAHADYVAHDLAVDQQRWQRDVEPAAAFAVLTDFFQRRPPALREALDALGAGEEPEVVPEAEDAGADEVDSEDTDDVGSDVEFEAEG